MKKNVSECIAIYQERLQTGEMQIAYKALVRFVMSLRRQFSRIDGYTVRNVSPGYLDYTYFAFSDDFLRSRELRYGIILNHRNMRFELWLMGQNEATQKAYWNLLKDTEWNEGVEDMPHYSVLETVLVDDPDFSDLPALSDRIEQSALRIIDDIRPHIV